MQYRTLGRTGVQVSTLALGASTAGTPTPATRRPLRRSRICSARGRSAASALRPSLIDTIVASGIDLAAAENHDTPPALLQPPLRRR